MTPDPVAALAQLAPSIQAASAGIEAARRLPLDLVAALRDTGAFRLSVPRAVGGLESDVATLVTAIETVAAADGSAGWCVMIGATTGVVSAFLEPEVARAIYGSGAITGGVFAPRGRATPVDGGYRVSGRWAFGSGCQHCDWLMGGCTIAVEPAVAPRMMILPAREVQIIDTWDVSGLRGTGSHDLVVNDRFVPATHSVSLVADRPRASGALYRFPVFGLLALGIAGVSLGVARAAIDALVALANDKTPSDSRRRLSERGVIQSEVARATAELGAARAYLFEQIDRAWTSAARGDDISLETRSALRLAATHTAHAAAAVTTRMYDAGGGSAIYATSPLQRCFRDAHTATAHAMVATSTWELTGRVLLGLPTDPTFL